MAETADLLVALKTFSNLPFNEREKIVAALESAPPAIDLNTLASHVAKATSNDSEFLSRFVEWLSGFVLSTVANRSYAAELARMVSEWLGAQGGSRDEPGAIRKQLHRLLTAERSLGITSKAQQVMWGHGKVFRDAHLTTQIRPIFLLDLDSKPENAVLIHDLRLDYMEGGTNHSICLGMARRQLIQLRSVLERALNKEASLRNSQNFNYLSENT